MAVEFKYKARKHDGQKLTGTIEAKNSEQVVKKLKNRGYYITSLEKKKKNLDLSQYFKFNKRVKISDLAVFSQQFAVMINAGVSLVESLEIMQKQIDHPRLAEVVKSVQEDVETGSSLAEALGNYPDVFPRLYRQLIRAGETGGVLDEVLNRLAEHYERQDELINKVKSALYYPLVVLLVAMAVVIFLVANVVPTFVSMFSGLGAQLPLPTRMLLGTSTFIQNYWWLILSFFLLLAYAFYRFYKTSRGKYKLDSLLLKIPVIGNMFKKIYLARFSSTLAILLDSGVDLLSS
ncbi:MAG: type II secretion system F family protein, partial [Halanaerobiales bacterium]